MIGSQGNTPNYKRRMRKLLGQQSLKVLLVFVAMLCLFQMLTVINNHTTSSHQTMPSLSFSLTTTTNNVMVPNRHSGKVWQHHASARMELDEQMHEHGPRDLLKAQSETIFIGTLEGNTQLSPSSSLSHSTLDSMFSKEENSDMDASADVKESQTVTYGEMQSNVNAVFPFNKNEPSAVKVVGQRQTMSRIAENNNDYKEKKKKINNNNNNNKNNNNESNNNQNNNKNNNENNNSNNNKSNNNINNIKVAGDEKTSVGARSKQSLDFLEDWRKRGKGDRWRNKDVKHVSELNSKEKAQMISQVEQNRLAAGRISLRGRKEKNITETYWEVPRSVVEGIAFPFDEDATFPYNKTLFVPVVTDSDKNWEKAHRKYLHSCYNCSDATTRWTKLQRKAIVPEWYTHNVTDSQQWSSQAQSILKGMMVQPRRNHWTLWWEEEQKLINLGGRHARSIETIDFQTGQRNILPLNNMDDIHHLDGGFVDAVEPGTGRKLGYKEIWITCAFYSSMVNKEETLDRVVVVDMRTMEWRWGPYMDIGRGSCMGFKLQYKNYELICGHGGSVGEHNAAIMVQHTSCYDRVRQRWIQLPREPVALDHGNVQVVPAGTCGANSPQRIVAFHGRHGAYGVPNRNLFALDVTNEDLDNFPDVLNNLAIEDVLSASTAVDDMVFEGGWLKFMTVSKKHRRPPHAPASVSFDRYVVSWGGDCYKLDEYNGRLGKAPMKVMDSIIIYDMCSAKYCVSQERMTKERFALFATRVGQEHAAVCGGQADGRDPTFLEWGKLVYGDNYAEVDGLVKWQRALNYPACELYNMRTLVNECESWEDGTVESGEA